MTFCSCACHRFLKWQRQHHRLCSPYFGPQKVLYFLYIHRRAGVSQELLAFKKKISPHKKSPFKSLAYTFSVISCYHSTQKNRTHQQLHLLSTHFHRLLNHKTSDTETNSGKKNKFEIHFLPIKTQLFVAGCLVERRPWRYIATLGAMKSTCHDSPRHRCQVVPNVLRGNDRLLPAVTIPTILLRKTGNLVASTSVHLIRILTARHTDWYSSEPLCLCWQFFDFSCTTNR